MSMFGADIAELEEKRLERFGAADKGALGTGASLPPALRPNFCMECGHKTGGGKFCVNCGSKVDPRLNTEYQKADHSTASGYRAIDVPDLPPSLPMPAGGAAAAAAADSGRDASLRKWNETAGPVATMSVPEGCCAGCYQLLDGEVVTALKQDFHSACFKCGTCRTNLNGKTFKRTSPTNPKPCCVPCYEKSQTPVCHKCQQPITNAYVERAGNIYHAKCQ